MTVQELFDKRVLLANQAFEKLTAMETVMLQTCNDIIACLKKGNKIIVCGNGGSAAESQHFTTELVGRFRTNRKSLPAVSLTADGVALTCIANDFGWDAVFSRQVEGLAQDGDILFCISTSGNSQNIINALKTAKEMKIASIALLGKNGGAAAAFADTTIIAPGEDTASIQEVQLWCIHTICEAVEAAFPMVH